MFRTTLGSVLEELALLEILASQPLTAARAATLLAKSRHSTHSAVSHLVRDGHLVRLRNGRRTYLRVTGSGIEHLARLRMLLDEAMRLKIRTPASSRLMV